MNLMGFLCFCHMAVVSDCGAGGIRTLVQTSNNNAFYMLSSDSFFDARPTQNRLSYA